MGIPLGSHHWLAGVQLPKHSLLGSLPGQAKRGQRERPFLDTLSIGVLSLRTKRESGPDSICVQQPEKNEKGVTGQHYFGSVLWPQDTTNNFGFVSRMGNPRVLACLLCAPWDLDPDRRQSTDKNDYREARVIFVWITEDMEMRGREREREIKRQR